MSGSLMILLTGMGVGLGLFLLSMAATMTGREKLGKWLIVTGAVAAFGVPLYHITDYLIRLASAYLLK